MGKASSRHGHGAYGEWIHRQHLANALQAGGGFAFGGAGLYGLGITGGAITKLAQAEALERSILTDLAKFEALAGAAATVELLSLVTTVFAARVKDGPRRGRPKGTGRYAEIDRKAVGVVRGILRKNPDLKPTTVLRELSLRLSERKRMGSSAEAILQRLKVAWRQSQTSVVEPEEE